jgi:predicted nucleotidyltransferase
MNNPDNIRRIKSVSDALQELNQQVVFVGGATVGLYSDRRQTIVPRVTDDVDAIIEVLGYGAHADFEEKLRAKGFADDSTSHVRCRYRLDNADEQIIVDIMPTTDLAMGFENRWYPEGFKEAIVFGIDEDTTIKILSPPYFVATKMEAFKHRGYSDPRQSQDFEDIVFIFENRRTIWNELGSVNTSLGAYLKSELSKLIESSNIHEWIDCHVSFVSPPPTDLIINNIKELMSQFK